MINEEQSIDNQVKFPKISVLWIFILDQITLGIYPCFWYWRFHSLLQKDARLRALKPPKALFLTPPVALIVVLILSFIETQFPGSLEQYSPKFWVNIATKVANWTFVISLVALAFKGCDVLSYYFRVEKKTEVRCSKIIAFFLNHLYLQYKINKFAEEPPVPGWLEPRSLRKIFAAGILLLFAAAATPILWIGADGFLAAGVTFNNPRIVKFGLLLGAPVNPKGDKAPPLGLVCATLKVPNMKRDKSAEILQMLLARGADVNQSFKSGHTPLMSAVKAEDIQIVDLLLSHGADTNKATVQAEGDEPAGTTALMISAKTGNVQIARKLIEKGAQVNLKNEQNKSALGIASASGQAEMVEVLKSAGAIDESQPKVIQEPTQDKKSMKKKAPVRKKRATGSKRRR